MLQPPPGCAFAPRCVHARPVCTTEVPDLRPFGAGETACLRAEELAGGVQQCLSQCLEVTDLVKNFQVRRARGIRVETATVQAVSGVSFQVDAGQTLGSGRRIGLRQDDGRPAACCA